MHEIIQINYINFTALLVLTFFILTSSITKDKKRLFIISVIITYLMFACNIIHYLFLGKTEYLTMMKISSAINYSISCTVMLPISKLSGVLSKKFFQFLNILAIINGIISISSIFNGCVFNYTSDATMTLGKLAFISYFLSLFYLIVIVFVSFKKFRLGFTSEAILLWLMVVGIILAIILNVFFDYDFLISGMSVSCCTFYFLFFNSQTFSRDALTGALNRHSFYVDIDKFSNKSMYIVSLDLNNLKKINDNKGHIEGDKAILAVAECALKILPKNYRFYRMGGDEYAILCINSNEEDILKITKNLQRNVKLRGYDIAIGFAKYTPEMNFNEVFKQADKMMYKNKIAMKHELPR